MNIVWGERKRIPDRKPGGGGRQSHFRIYIMVGCPGIGLVYCGPDVGVVHGEPDFGLVLGGLDVDLVHGYLMSARCTRGPM